MKRLALIGIFVVAVPTVGMVLVMVAMGAWDRYYWWAAPDLARAFRASASESVNSDAIEGLTGLTSEDALARVEAAGFSCLPRSGALHCARFVPEMSCGEDWELVLETTDGRVSQATGTKTATCIEAKEVH